MNVMLPVTQRNQDLVLINSHISEIADKVRIGQESTPPHKYMLTAEDKEWIDKYDKHFKIGRYTRSILSSGNNRT
jgi:hypothetical protein